MVRIILRGHHLLCTRLFLGNGYNQDFTENMKEIVSRTGLDKSGRFGSFPLVEQLLLVCGKDNICDKCPNLSAKENICCMLGDEDVQKKDRLTLQYAGLLENNIYTLEEAEAGIGKISRKQFEEICGGCRWYGEYCRYEDLLG